jgi:hypothetical protein
MPIEGEQHFSVNQPSHPDHLIQGPWVFSQHGLNVNVRNNETKYFPRGMILGYLNFTPLGLTVLEPEYLTANLILGIKGLTAFFDEVENYHLQPEYLYGETNRQMARMAQQVGFSIIEETEDVHVMAKPSQVKASLDRLLTRKDRNNQSLMDKLTRRVKQ